MKKTTIAGLGLFAVGAAGFLMNLDLWGVWLFAGFMVITHD